VNEEFLNNDDTENEQARRGQIAQRLKRRSKHQYGKKKDKKHKKPILTTVQTEAQIDAPWRDDGQVSTDDLGGTKQQMLSPQDLDRSRPGSQRRRSQLEFGPPGIKEDDTALLAGLQRPPFLLAPISPLNGTASRV